MPMAMFYCVTVTFMTWCWKGVWLQLTCVFLRIDAITASLRKWWTGFSIFYRGTVHHWIVWRIYVACVGCRIKEAWKGKFKWVDESCKLFMCVSVGGWAYVCECNVQLHVILVTVSLKVQCFMSAVRIDGGDVCREYFCIYHYQKLNLTSDSLLSQATLQ